MLDSSITGNRLLICSGMEKSDIERVSAVPDIRKEDGIGMSLRIVIILAVAGKTAEEHPVVFIIPLVDRQENKPLVKAPCVRQRSHERVVNHIPALSVVLLFHVQYLENGGTGFADSEVSELSIDVRYRNAVRFAYGLDLIDNSSIIYL